MGSLSLKQVVETLNVPELTVMRWVRQGKIPFIRSGNVFLFPEAELKLWAKSKGLSHIQSSSDIKASSLSEAIRSGGCFFLEKHGNVFDEMLAAMYPHGFPDGLLQALQDREDKMSTAIGSGIALPHPSHCQHFNFSESKVGLFFSYPPQNFGARDANPVFCFFLILALNSKAHLKLMSQIAAFIKDTSRYQLLWDHYQNRTIEHVAEIF